MSSFITWVAGVIGDSVTGVTGGSIFLMIMFGLLGLALLLFRFQVSMPFGLMAGFFALAILSQTLDNPLDPILGTGTSGISTMLYLILVGMTGVLIWHLFVKKSQAGVG